MSVCERSLFGRQRDGRYSCTIDYSICFHKSIGLKDFSGQHIIVIFHTVNREYMCVLFGLKVTVPCPRPVLSAFPL